MRLIVLFLSHSGRSTSTLVRRHLTPPTLQFSPTNIFYLRYDTVLLDENGVHIRIACVEEGCVQVVGHHAGTCEIFSPAISPHELSPKETFPLKSIDTLSNANIAPVGDKHRTDFLLLVLRAQGTP